MNLTIAVARDAPVGVAIAAWSGRVSRMYRIDLEKDEVTPGQFVKARANVLAISNDGKYVVYFAEAFHKMERSYVAVSHVPYFTAHAFFYQFHLFKHNAKFSSDTVLEIRTTASEDPWADSRGLVKERIDPGCPFEIKRLKWAEFDADDSYSDKDKHWAADSINKRIIIAIRHKVVAYTADCKHRKVLASLLREPFQEIPPPDWAQRW